MKKAFDQTVRDLKREVNKKVLKVPGIEQKILDATSNEPWGPHGSNLADLAQATQNYHEYQIIMNVIWKRINDTGKNWRHVYKALTVLEYLVGHGSERVIDEIREHAYQISTLSNFQYIDSSGRDQGNNVRRKSQVLVALVNDKEKVQEIREKALANKDKYRGSFSTGGAYRPGGYGDRYGDDRYYGRDEDRNGYGREREWGYGGDDRSGRGRRSYDRDGDRYNREGDERGGRDNYRDDDSSVGRGNGDYQFGPRRSFDKDRSCDDDTRSPPQQLDRKVSDKSLGVPPSYEEATTGSENHVKNERNGIAVATPLPKVSSPPAPEASSPVGVDHGQVHTMDGASTTSPRQDTDGFDEFDPRGSIAPVLPAAPPAASSSEMDFFDDPLGSLALVPVTPSITTSESLGPSNSGFEAGGDNPFGDSPFKAVPLENLPDQPLQGIAPNLFSAPPTDLKAETAQNYDLGDPLGGLTYIPSVSNGQHAGSSPQWLPPDVPVSQGSSSSSDDVLNAILPQTGPTPTVSPQWPQEAAPQNFQSGHGSFLHHAVLPGQQAAPFTSPVVEPLAPAAPAPAPNAQTGPSNFISQPAFSLLSLEAAAPTAKPQPAKKFETKSTVWTDTLNRGLVNLNISGPKTNPLADIGIDFESINRKEKLREKSVEAPVASTTSMGKAMGAGSGMGRASAGGMVRPNPAMMNSGMSIGMGGYGGGMNQPMAPGMGMSSPMGMGMNMGSGYNPAMRPPPPTGMAMARPSMPGVVGYNPAMGIGGGYGSQQPYGGYR